MQYLGYCTGCNSSNINHWFNPMVVKGCHVIDPCLISFFLHFLPLHFSFFFSFRFTKFQKFSLPPNLDVRGTPASNLHDHGYKWKLLRPTRPPPAVLAGLTLSSPNVSLFSHSLKSSCGQASGCPFSGSASQRHHQRWWPSGTHFLLNLFSLLFFFLFMFAFKHD